MSKNYITICLVVFHCSWHSSTTVAFFNTPSSFPKSLDVPQLSFTIPPCSSLSFIIFHHPLSYLTIILLLPKIFQHLPPHYAMSSPKQNKMSSNQNFATQVRNYHGCPFWDLGMSQEHLHPPPPPQMMVTCILHLYSLRCKPISCFYIDKLNLMTQAKSFFY